MLPPGSRVVIRGLAKAPEYNGARADVLHYDTGKGRYGVQLIHPAFHGKSLLLKEDNLDFLYVAFGDSVPAARAELRAGRVALRATAAYGTALGACQAFAVGDVLLRERPFLVVANPDGHEKWMVRWDCLYEQVRQARSAIVDAFHGLSDGGADMTAHLLPDARRTVEVLWSCAPGGAERYQREAAEAETEAVRCAADFGRWQTNQHTLPGGRSALYLVAPMVAHSCYPNVEWEDPKEDGYVELRAIRPISAGDILGVNYMQPEFLRLPVAARRAVLQAKRFFRCACPRCEQEAPSP